VMRAVSGLGLSVFQRPHSAMAQSGAVLAASLIQVDTESWTYREGSDRSGSRSGSPRPGSLLNSGIWVAQTPRGLRDSLANHLRFSLFLAVHGMSRSMDSVRSRVSRGRIAIQTHSRTPKCESSAMGRQRSRSPASSTSLSAPIAKHHQPRTVSEGCDINFASSRLGR